MLRLCQTVRIYVKNTVLLAKRKTDNFSFSVDHSNLFSRPPNLCLGYLKLSNLSLFLCFRNIFRGLWTVIKLSALGLQKNEGDE